MSTPSSRIYALSGETIERLILLVAQQVVLRVPEAARDSSWTLIDAGLPPGEDPEASQSRVRDAMARIESALGGSPDAPDFTHDGSAPALANVLLWSFLRWQVESDILDIEVAIEIHADLLIKSGATPEDAQHELHRLIDEAIARAAQVATD